MKLSIQYSIILFFFLLSWVSRCFIVEQCFILFAIFFNLSGWLNTCIFVYQLPCSAINFGCLKGPSPVECYNFGHEPIGFFF